MTHWIDLEDNLLRMAGAEVEFDLRARGRYYKAERGARDHYGLRLEPDEPAYFEVDEVQFKISISDDWKTLPLSLIPDHAMVGIELACLQEAEDGADREACEAYELRDRHHDYREVA